MEKNCPLVHQLNFLPPNEIEEIREPIIKSTVLCPNKYVGDVIELAMSKRVCSKRFAVSWWTSVNNF